MRSTLFAIVLATGLPLALGCSSSDEASPAVVDLTPCIPDDQPAAARDACTFKAGAAPEQTLGTCASGKRIKLPIEHVVLLMQENRSFDHYLGHLKPKYYDDVEVPPDGASNPNASGTAQVPWHHLETYCFDDTNHEWEGSHDEYDDGKNDGFPKANANPDGPSPDPEGERSMGFYDDTDIPFAYELADTFATSDHYHCSLLGPTWPNRMYFYAASSFGLVENVPAPDSAKPIWQLLDENGISWRYYDSNLLTAAMFTDYLLSSGHLTDGHIRKISQFATDVAAGDMAQVTFLDPVFSADGAAEGSEHPPADPQVGQKFLYDQVQTVMSGPLWSKTAMFITYDENGGLYDHVPPPAACAPDDLPPSKGADRGGFDRLGFRVPVYVISPFAKKHFMSHKTHSHTSILRFVEATFGLPALSNRDANSDAMLDMFDFENPPFLEPPVLHEPPIDQQKLDACKAIYPK